MSPATGTSGMGGLELLRSGRVRDDFPLLGEGAAEGLVFLDSGASAQKPQVVLDAVDDLYRRNYANIHRGVYRLSQEATRLYEGARGTVRAFLGAAHDDEIVFVRGATEGINLVANAFVAPRLREGDEVLVTEMEHHSNLVPWQMLCRRTGAVLRHVPLADTGELRLELLPELLTPRTKVLAVAHVSNALGTVNPLAGIIALAHERGVPVVVDGAQAVPHLAVDVQALGCDFYVFSGHKIYGPTGIGAVYGRRERWREAEPWQGGGDMILTVKMSGSTWAEPPACFEAGTPHIAGAVGLAAALDYVTGLGLANVTAWENELVGHGLAVLGDVPGLRLIGTAPDRAAVFSFVLDGVHPHDVGTFLDADNIAVRTGHHCAQPVMDFFGVPATTRASLGLYNTPADLEALADSLRRIREFFGK